MTVTSQHHGYTYSTVFGWTWQRNPRTGRWEVFAPAATSPCATAATWALQQRQPPAPAPLHSAAGQPQAIPRPNLSARNDP